MDLGQTHTHDKPALMKFSVKRTSLTVLLTCFLAGAKSFIVALTMCSIQCMCRIFAAAVPVSKVWQQAHTVSLPASCLQSHYLITKLVV